MMTARTGHIRNLVGIFLESRACLASAGVTATNAEVIDLVRLGAARRDARSGIAPNGIYDPRALADPRAL